MARFPTLRPPLPVTDPARKTDLQLTVTGLQANKGSWVHHRFDLFAIGFVTRGRGWYRVDDGRPQRLEAPAMFPVYPGAVFHYGPDEDTTWREYHVGVVGAGAIRWQRYGWLPTGGVVHPVGNASIIQELFERLLSLVRDPARGNGDRGVRRTTCTAQPDADARQDGCRGHGSGEHLL